MLDVGGRSFQVAARETILQAAERNGIALPSSCRVGGCGTCKCKVSAGKVKELTETGYLLSAEEIAEGYVLACQSVPQSDVTIELDPSAARAASAVIVSRVNVTHDIARIEAQLDAPLAYKAGQFANVTLDGTTRSYSFATPPSADGLIAFFVRRVPGGKMSTALVDEDVVGRRLQIEGPHGDFWLRDGDSAPLLLIAGGSGLAPILAILQDALAAGVSRSVTLLFGAREARDLYAQAEIEAIAQAWRGSFEFVPVTGGLVTDHIAAHLAPGAHAYLCGPPAMVDRACDELAAHGVARKDIRFDRFTTQADAAPAQEVAGVLHYLKFFLFHILGLFSAGMIIAGGRTITFGLVTLIAFYVVGDAISGDDTSTPKFEYPKILTVQLWLALPLLALIVFVSVWSVCSGDPLGFGATLTHLTGYDLLAARAATTFGHHVSAWIATGLMIGLVGTITGHELTHRTWDPVSLFLGRWLLAFSFDTSFAIEHVYGHHRYVSTIEDPATAPRGRSVYFHIVASTLKGNISAWKIEASRLAKRKRSVLSPHNAFLRGHLMSVVLLVIAYAMGGLVAAGFFFACALWGKALLEIVNYMEHYGMVRNPETPVQPRHSWNTNRTISSWTMFNLTRHSHHHAQGELPYQDLKPFPDAPMMINGYLTTLGVTLIPPLWHWLMTPKVLAWDRDYATDEERELATIANAKSGFAQLDLGRVRGG